MLIFSKYILIYLVHTPLAPMNEFEKQFNEANDFLKFGDYNLTLKRIIDFTLDTQSISFYRKTTGLLNWLDNNKEHDNKPEKLKELLKELHDFLYTLPQQPRKKVIEAVNIKKQYYSSTRFSLGPITLDLYAGDIIGLVGENGNGKTTLLRLLCSELNPSGGTINFNFDYTDLYDLRTKLVYIPQRTETWQGNMFENLVFTASCYGHQPEENELIVELTIARLGLRKYRNHKWKDLSSGYKMRFELARMLLRKPKVLLIDEPLANLDILAQQTILEDFKAIAKSPFRPIGIVLSSQQLYEVEKTSDQVIFLKNGIQKNLWENNENKNSTNAQPLVIEFESSWSQSRLNDIFLDMDIINLQYNGGTFIASFSGSHTVNDFMKTVIQHNIPILYFRNISNSTRRFFVS